MQVRLHGKARTQLPQRLKRWVRSGAAPASVIGADDGRKEAGIEWRHWRHRILPPATIQGRKKMAMQSFYGCLPRVPLARHMHIEPHVMTSLHPPREFESGCCSGSGKDEYVSRSKRQRRIPTKAIWRGAASRKGQEAPLRG